MTTPVFDQYRIAKVRIMGLPRLVTAGYDTTVSTVLSLTEPGPKRVEALVERTDMSAGAAGEVAMLSAEEWDTAVNAFKVDRQTYLEQALESLRATAAAVAVAHCEMAAPDDLSGLDEA